MEANTDGENLCELRLVPSNNFVGIGTSVELQSINKWL